MSGRAGRLLRSAVDADVLRAAAFVGAHHLARMVVMSALLPVLARRYGPRGR